MLFAFFHPVMPSVVRASMVGPGWRLIGRRTGIRRGSSGKLAAPAIYSDDFMLVP